MTPNPLTPHRRPVGQSEGSARRHRGIGGGHLFAGVVAAAYILAASLTAMVCDTGTWLVQVKVLKVYSGDKVQVDLMPWTTPAKKATFALSLAECPSSVSAAAKAFTKAEIEGKVVWMSPGFKDSKGIIRGEIYYGVEGKALSKELTQRGLAVVGVSVREM